VRNVDVHLDFKPYAHQRAAHAFLLTIRFLVLVWHRRAGKTVFAIAELILAASNATRERSRYGYVAPYLKQAKGVAWDYLKHFALAIPNTLINEVELSVTLPNGAKIRLFGADNPDTLRGLYFDGVVMDEVADMRPQVWGEIVRPALADRLGWALFIGTPKGVNLFSELYYSALRDAEWKADMRRASETGIIPPEELEQLRKTLSPSQYAQEMECDFSAAVDNVLLRQEDVLEAQRCSLSEAQYIYSPKVLGVDVARYGDDRTVIQPRQGLLALRPKILRNMNTMEVAGQVVHVIQKWGPDATFIDAGGIGAGVIDRVRQLGHPVIDVDFGGKPVDPRFENKRAEMWWLMADWARTGASLPDMQEYPADLTAPTFTYANARGRLQLESKDSMRERGLPSPDVGDALACTFHSPVAARGLQLPKHLQKRPVQDYDPYKDVQDYDPHEEGR
jgi:hypothetical protein